MGKISGYLDILNAIFMAMMLYVSVKASSGNMDDTNFAAASAVVAIFVIIGIILHIVGIVQMKQMPLAITGHVIAIIGGGLFLMKNGWALVALIAFVISAVLVLLSAKKMTK